MMFRLAFLLLSTAGLVACAPSRVCDEPQPYEAARPGPVIAVPDGLDELQAARQIEIPEASRKLERSPEDPCLDFPPVLRSEADDDEEE